MKILAFLIWGFVLISCASISQQSNSKEISKVELSEAQYSHIPAHNTKFIIHQHIPYCGGAAPTDEMLNRYSLYEEELILIDLSNNSQSIITGKNGLYYANLSIGKYALKEKYKDVSFDTFLGNMKSSANQYIIQGDNDCYKTWWQSNLYEFEITDESNTKTFNVSVPARCFTGINPCDYYNGPRPC